MLKIYDKNKKTNTNYVVIILTARFTHPFKNLNKGFNTNKHTEQYSKQGIQRNNPKNMFKKQEWSIQAKKPLPS